MEGSRRRNWLKSIDYIKKSKVFLLPMLEVSLYHQGGNDGVNHIIDVSFVQMGFPQIVIVFDNIDYIPLKEDTHRLAMCSHYVDSEYGDDNREIAMFFDVPKEYKKDFELFVQGKYSQFSDKYKALLVKSYGVKREEGLSPKTLLPNVNIYDAIHPTDELKKLMAKQLSTSNHRIDWRDIKEVLDPPNIELEEYKLIEELINE